MWADHLGNGFQWVGLLCGANPKGTIPPYLLLYCKTHSWALGVDLGSERAQDTASAELWPLAPDEKLAFIPFEVPETEKCLCRHYTSMLLYFSALASLLPVANKRRTNLFNTFFPPFFSFSHVPMYITHTGCNFHAVKSQSDRSGAGGWND